MDMCLLKFDIYLLKKKRKKKRNKLFINWFCSKKLYDVLFEIHFARCNIVSTGQSDRA